MVITITFLDVAPNSSPVNVARLVYKLLRCYWTTSIVIGNCRRGHNDIFNLQRFLAVAPIARFTPLVCNGNHKHHIAFNFVDHRIWKLPQKYLAGSVFGSLPAGCRVGQPVNAIECLCPKCMCGGDISFHVPPKRSADLCLRVGQDDYRKLAHSALRRALAAAQGTGVIVPSRKAAMRR